MTAGAWAVLLGVWAGAVASPGPDFAVVLRTSLTGGIRLGLAAAAGVTGGIVVWIGAALLGVLAVLAAHPVLFAVVRIAGAAFLILYGLRILFAVVRSVRARRAEQTVAEAGPGSAADAPGHAGGDAEAVPKTRSGFAAFRLGFLTNLLGNPKAVVFFGALFVGLLPPHITGLETGLVWAAMALVALAFFSLLAFLAGQPAIVRAYQRAETVIEAVLGIVFVILGILVIATA